ncbi:MAG: AEC family transporter [Bacteroidota bacterium]
MNLALTINQVTTLFFLIVVGYIIRKLGILSRELNKGLSDLLLYVTLPFSIITSFNFPFTQTFLANGVIVLLISIAIHLFAILISKLLYFKYSLATNRVLRAATVFSNCGFMGFPILEAVYGAQGVFYGSFYVLTFQMFIWTAGVVIFTGKEDPTTWRQILNPAVIAVITGFTLFVFSIKLPEPLFNTLAMVGSMTTPISMLIIGSLLVEIEFSQIFSGFSIFYVTLVRLVILPLLAVACLILLGVKGITLGVPVLATAMPAAALIVVFAEKHGADAILASRAVFLSTILSIITIPAMIALIQFLD